MNVLIFFLVKNTRSFQRCDSASPWSNGSCRYVTRSIKEKKTKTIIWGCKFIFLPQIFRLFFFAKKNPAFILYPFLLVTTCCLLYCLLLFLCSKQYGTRSDCSKGSSLSRVHIVWFHDKILSEVHLNICSRRKKQMFLGQK